MEMQERIHKNKKQQNTQNENYNQNTKLQQLQLEKFMGGKELLSILHSIENKHTSSISNKITDKTRNHTSENYILGDNAYTPMFLETKEKQQRSVPSSIMNQASKFLGYAFQKNDNNFSCCTVCPSQFIEVSSEVKNNQKRLHLEHLWSSSKPTEEEKLRAYIQENGCCTTCPADFNVSPMTRLDESQDGPYGLKPKVKKIPKNYLLMPLPTGTK